ncbi:recombinase family protein [Deinococcus roseus]|uniref:Resolvase n=1 Tax=Deinococcus roseus TaxID=392414 RepID=A0ABQ2DJB6_9DEIO|nr:recombinase family protein [Deinococcus roseus]GGJ57558.1 resolvase [Deinococcus roseus]
MGEIVGYARVSTRDQNLELQLDSLKKEGCERIFTDHLSGASTDRPGFEEALKFLRSGDKLVVWKLDRLGRSLQHLIETVKLLEARGVALHVVQEKLDTSSTNGKLFFHIFGALAEFERDVIRDRTRAGLEAARARGRVGGRKHKLSGDQIKAARDLLKAEHSVTEVARMLQVSRSTLYRYLHE